MKKIERLNQEVFIRKDIQKLNNLNIINDTVVERIERLNDNIEIPEKIGELILSGLKAKEVANKLNIPYKKVSYIQGKFGFKKLHDKEFHYNFPKKKDNFEKALATKKLKIVKDQIKKLDSRSLSRIQNEFNFKLTEIKIEEIKKLLLEIRDFEKVGKKFGYSEPRKWATYFFKKHKIWCKKNKLSFEVRKRTSKDDTIKRNKFIISDYNKGKKPDELASKYKLDKKYIEVILSEYRIKNGKRKESLPTDLKVRNKQIFKDFSKGFNYAELATKYELDRSYIGKIINDIIKSKK